MAGFIRHGGKRTSKEVWVILLVFLPPFDSPILKPDFDLLYKWKYKSNFSFISPKMRQDPLWRMNRITWISVHVLCKVVKACIRATWPIRPEVIPVSATRSLSTPPGWNASLSQGYPQYQNRRYPFLHLGGKRSKILWELSVFPKKLDTMSLPRLEPGPLDRAFTLQLLFF